MRDAADPNVRRFITQVVDFQNGLRSGGGGTWSENRPSESVLIPIVVPFTTTAAPTTGLPATSRTMPETVTGLFASASERLFFNTIFEP